MAMHLAIFEVDSILHENRASCAALDLHSPQGIAEINESATVHHALSLSDLNR